jgi:hypothetical protein
MSDRTSLVTQALYRRTECILFALQFLGAFAKLREATISFLLSVCMSSCPHGTTRLPLDGFSLNLVFEYFFRKSVENIQGSLKSDKNIRYFTRRPVYIYDNMSMNSS